MFFSDSHKHFFRPLTGKYREQIVECLRLFYERLYSSMAAYGRVVARDQVAEIFQEAITRAPLLDEADGEEAGAPVRNEREQANWVLNLLLEHGWLEKQVDEATLQSSYAFSRMGRLFTQPMVETAGGRFRTRHRNTRNTRNALQSFVDGGEVYDLLDAFEYSERIIADFTDVIAELDDKKRQLVREVEAQQLVQRASDEFFDFMEKRFVPDLAVRLSADSVEKYRDEIQTLIAKARRKQKGFKADAERALRKAAPELVTDPKVSVYWNILDGIEGRMHSASEIMLPALRNALHSFTRRADIVIRQLSFSGSGRQGDVVPLCRALVELPGEEQARRLEAAAEAMAGVNAGLPDPGALRLYTGQARRVVNSSAEEQAALPREARRDLFIQQMLEKAFVINRRELAGYLRQALGDGHAIRTQNLPVRSASELLWSAHAIEAGTADKGSSEFFFRVEPTGQQARGEYFDERDEFTIELIELERHAD